MDSFTSGWENGSKSYQMSWMIVCVHMLIADEAIVFPVTVNHIVAYLPLPFTTQSHSQAWVGHQMSTFYKQPVSGLCRLNAVDDEHQLLTGMDDYARHDWHSS